jgi:D-alanine transfer protein
VKKIVALLCAVVILIASNIFFIRLIDDNYCDNVGAIFSDDKYKSMVMQGEALDRNDTLLMYGASYLTQDIKSPFSADSLFANKRDGFQVFTVGGAGYDPLVLVLNFGALASRMSGHKVVFFITTFLGGDNLTSFEAKSSKEMFYGLMFNPVVDNSNKQAICQQMIAISRQKGQIQTDDFKDILYFSELYSSSKMVNKIEFALLIPYYRMEYYLLGVKDELEAYTLLKADKNKVKYIVPQSENIDWNNEMAIAVSAAKKNETNNPFGMTNSNYNKIKDSLGKLKGSSKKWSYIPGVEYDNLNMIVQICKDNNIAPLFIIMPVNGKYYDYLGYKQSERQKYYRSVKDLVTGYGFDVADLSTHEYEDYFFNDAVHQDYKGWVYVDEAIDRYYHQS